MRVSDSLSAAQRERPILPWADDFFALNCYPFPQYYVQGVSHNTHCLASSEAGSKQICLVAALTECAQRTAFHPQPFSPLHTWSNKWYLNIWQAMDTTSRWRENKGPDPLAETWISSQMIHQPKSGGKFPQEMKGLRDRSRALASLHVSFCSRTQEGSKHLLRVWQSISSKPLP